MAGDTVHYRQPVSEAGRQARGHSNSKIIDGWPSPPLLPPLFLSGLWEPANERAAADGMQQPECILLAATAAWYKWFALFFSFLNSLHSVGFMFAFKKLCIWLWTESNGSNWFVFAVKWSVCETNAPFTQYELLRFPEVFHFNLIYWLQCSEHSLSARSWVVCEWDGNGVKTNRKKIIKFKSSNNEMKMQFTRQHRTEHRTNNGRSQREIYCRMRSLCLHWCAVSQNDWVPAIDFCWRCMTHTTAYWQINLPDVLSGTHVERGRNTVTDMQSATFSHNNCRSAVTYRGTTDVPSDFEFIYRALLMAEVQYGQAVDWYFVGTPHNRVGLQKNRGGKNNVLS